MEFKKFLLIFGLFLSLSLLITPFASSVQTEINPTYKKGETIIAKISGNFLENIQKNNIRFYRRHLATSIDPYDIIKINDDFYIYAKIGETKIPDNYSMRIENVLHMEGSQQTRDDITLNFTILDSTADFSAWPGAISTSDDFYIEVQNLKNFPLTIAINGQPQTNSSNNESTFLDWLFGGNQGSTGSGSSGDETPQTITLQSGEIGQIGFSVSQTEFTNILLSSTNQEYLIPANLIYIAPETTDNSTNNTIVNETIGEGETGGLNTSNNETISNDTVQEDNQTFWDKITGKQNAQDQTLTKEQITEKENTPAFEDDGVLKTCAELRGNVCNTNEECNGTTEYAKDVACCIGECVQIQNKKNNTKLIGWILIALAAIVIFWFINKKSKKKTKSVDLMGKLKKMK